MRVNVRISPFLTAVILTLVVLFLDIAYISTKLIEYFASPEKSFGLYHYFDLGKEANLPTFISSLYLLYSSSLAFLVVGYKKIGKGKLIYYWAGIAVGLLYMSIDEATEIHEGIIGPLFAHFFGRGEGIWSYGWYIPFIPLLAILFLAYIKFLYQISNKYAFMLVLSGVIFFGGAVGIEMVQAYISYHRIEYGALYFALIIEETFEMLGVVLLIYTLLEYLRENEIRLDISF